MLIQYRVFITLFILFVQPVTLLAFFVVAPSNRLTLSYMSEDLWGSVRILFGISYLTLAVVALIAALYGKSRVSTAYFLIPVFTAVVCHFALIMGYKDPYGLIFLSAMTIFLEYKIAILAYRCRQEQASKGMLLILSVAIIGIIGQCVRVEEVIFGSGTFNFLQFTWKSNFLLISNICMVVGMNIGYANYYISELEKKSRILIDQQNELSVKNGDLDKAIDNYEREMERSARLSSLNNISMYTAAIIHEISQPLQALKYAIANSRYLIQTRDYASLTVNVDEIDGITNEMQKFVGTLRSMLAKGNSATEVFSPPEVILNSITLISSECARRSILFECEINGGGAMISANRSLLQRIFFNLITNSIEALETVKNCEKSLRVRTSIQSDANVFNLEVITGGVSLSVANNISVNSDLISNTEKEDGMGLGLAFANKILGSWGGSMSMRSTDRAEAPETTFAIHIPLYEAR